MRTDQIVAFQEALKKCPQVWGVYIRCDGEESLDSVWATKEAAELARDAHNNGGRRFGRATIAPFSVRPEAMALELYGSALRRSEGL